MLCSALILKNLTTNIYIPPNLKNTSKVGGCLRIFLLKEGAVVNGHRIAASASAMPHSIEKIGAENGFNGHSDIHFLNSRQHKDYNINENHQRAVKIAAGI